MSTTKQRTHRPSLLDKNLIYNLPIYLRLCVLLILVKVNHASYPYQSHQTRSNASDRIFLFVLDRNARTLMILKYKRCIIITQDQLTGLIFAINFKDTNWIPSCCVMSWSGFVFSSFLKIWWILNRRLSDRRTYFKIFMTSSPCLQKVRFDRHLHDHVCVIQKLILL